jgi:hypothetical protein
MLLVPYPSEISEGSYRPIMSIVLWYSSPTRTNRCNDQEFLGFRRFPRCASTECSSVHRGEQASPAGRFNGMWIRRSCRLPTSASLPRGTPVQPARSVSPPTGRYGRQRKLTSCGCTSDICVDLKAGRPAAAVLSSQGGATAARESSPRATTASTWPSRRRSSIQSEASPFAGKPSSSRMRTLPAVRRRARSGLAEPALLVACTLEIESVKSYHYACPSN